MNRSATVHRPLCPDGRAIEDAPCAHPCRERSRPYVLAATILASAMAFIDGSIVTIALPAMQQGLQTTFAALQWVVNSYALLLGGLILIGGSAGDRFGRRRIFLAGLVIFSLASIACAMAPNVELLIVARAVKGIGAALLVPQSLAIIAAAFPQDVRGRAIGIWAGASSIATALGPPLGGLLIDGFDWRAVFWINVPIAAVAIWMTLAHVPESRDDSATGPLDWAGGALSILAFGLLTVGLTILVEGDDSSAAPALMILMGIVVLFFLVRMERRAAEPLIPLKLFRDRTFSAANVMTLFLYGAFTGILFLLPFDLIGRRGLSATDVGLVLLPLGIIIGALSRFAGDWSDRIGVRPPLALGSALVAFAAVGLSLGIADLWLGVVLPIVVLSMGMALVVAPLTTAIMNAAPDAQSGAASGVNNAASRLASLFAIAIIGAVASAVFAGEIGDSAAARFGMLPASDDPERGVLEAAFKDAYRVSMWLAAVWGGLAVILASSLSPKESPS